MQRPPSTGRYARALIPRDADPDPRGRIPNDNPAVGTVGPNVPAGFGDTHVGYPAGFPPYQAEAWAGWPLEWGTPWMESDPTWSTFFGFGAADPAGYLNRVSTVGTCVDKNSRQLASFPAYAVRGRHPVPLPSWYSVSPEPELYADWVEFMKAATNSYQLHGETILWATARFGDGYPSRFIALDPGAVDVDDVGDYWLTGAGRDRLDADRRIRLNRRDVCHIKYQRAPGVGRRGLGPLAWAGRHLVSAEVLDRYAVEIARNGVSALLTNPVEQTAEQADLARAQWSASRRAHPGVPGVVSGGWEYHALSLSPRDMALLDLKVFDLQMIASAFGVPPGLVGLPQAGGGLEYSSVDMLADHHWRDALRPMAQAFSGALSSWLLPRGTVLEFNPDRYTQPGFGERAGAYQTLHGIVDDEGRRAITVNEIRVAERFEPYSDVAAGPGDTGVTTEVDGLVGAERG
jgi:HK97 family phage portal protein